MRQDSTEVTNMKKYLFGLVKFAMGVKFTLELLNELIAFVEKANGYLHIVLNYCCLSWDEFPDGKVEAQIPS